MLGLHWIVRDIILGNHSMHHSETLGGEPGLIIHKVRWHGRGKGFWTSTPATIVSLSSMMSNIVGWSSIGGSSILNQPVVNLLLVQLFCCKLWSEL